jgi:hypothetical protein
VKFFFDNCISSNLAEAMAYLNRQHHEIEHLTKKFDADALDVDWIPVVAKDTNVILVSADPAITTAKKEKEIWRQSGLTGFFFGSGFTELGRWSQIAAVVNWWPEIVRQAKVAPKGSGYLLQVNGHRKPPKLIYSPPGTK